jgi:hypothetical protein
LSKVEDSGGAVDEHDTERQHRVKRALTRTADHRLKKRRHRRLPSSTTLGGKVKAYCHSTDKSPILLR